VNILTALVVASLITFQGQEVPKVGTKVALDEHGTLGYLCRDAVIFNKLMDLHKADASEEAIDDFKLKKKVIDLEGKTNLLILKFVDGMNPYIMVRVLDGPHKNKTGIMSAIIVWKAKKHRERTIYALAQVAVFHAMEEGKKLPESERKAAFLKSTDKGFALIRKEYKLSEIDLLEIMDKGRALHW
jgi:hypothetical protein